MAKIIVERFQKKRSTVKSKKIHNFVYTALQRISNKSIPSFLLRRASAIEKLDQIVIIVFCNEPAEYVNKSLRRHNDDIISNTSSQQLQLKQPQSAASLHRSTNNNLQLVTTNCRGIQSSPPFEIIILFRTAAPIQAH